MSKTYEEINGRIRSGKAVVCTAEEVIDLVRKKGAEKAAEEVDVVTTGTFGAMCSSGAFLNFGHSTPPIRMTNILLNDVQAYGGLAAVDTYIGATQMTEDPARGYGGAHVIEDLIAGKSIHLRAWGPGTDCYVRKEIDTHVTLDDLNEAYLYNPRNAYQNYSVAVNTSDRTIYTYMGKLLPKMRNASYSSAGQLSPLLNDPHCDVIGVGTRIFLAGGEGYVSWQGTQFKTNVEEVNGVPVAGARTLAVIGDMKQMDSRYVRGLDITGYGISLAIGIGVPLPVLNPDVIRRAAISDEEIFAEMLDYSLPSGRTPMARYSYAQLRSGKIEYGGKSIRTSSMSSYAGAKKVASELKDRIEKGEFLLNPPSMMLPRESKVKPLEIRGRSHGQKGEDRVRRDERAGIGHLHPRDGVRAQAQRPQGRDQGRRQRHNDHDNRGRPGQGGRGRCEAGGARVRGQGAGEAHPPRQGEVLQLRRLHLPMPHQVLRVRPCDLGGPSGHRHLHRLRVVHRQLLREGAQAQHMRSRFQVEESIVTIVSDEPYIRVAEQAVFEAREQISSKIAEDPFFGITYDPYPPDPKDPELVRRMCAASVLSGVGPMAGVAGAVAVHAVERMVEAGAEEAIVENGGDIAFFSRRPVPIGVYADDSVFRDVAYMVRSEGITGICSSSARIGPSVSLGSSDLCTVFSDDVILADCCATALGNMVDGPDGMAEAVERIGNIAGVKGCVAVCKGKVAMFGDVPEMVGADCSNCLY